MSNCIEKIRIGIMEVKRGEGFLNYEVDDQRNKGNGE